MMRANFCDIDFRSSWDPAKVPVCQGYWTWELGEEAAPHIGIL